MVPFHSDNNIVLTGTLEDGVCPCCGSRSHWLIKEIPIVGDSRESRMLSIPTFELTCHNNCGYSVVATAKDFNSATKARVLGPHISRAIEDVLQFFTNVEHEEGTRSTSSTEKATPVKKPKNPKRSKYNGRRIRNI